MLTICQADQSRAREPAFIQSVLDDCNRRSRPRIQIVNATAAKLRRSVTATNPTNAPTRANRGPKIASASPPGICASTIATTSDTGVNHPNANAALRASRSVRRTRSFRYNHQAPTTVGISAPTAPIASSTRGWVGVPGRIATTARAKGPVIAMVTAWATTVGSQNLLRTEGLRFPRLPSYIPSATNRLACSFRMQWSWMTSRPASRARRAASS